MNCTVLLLAAPRGNNRLRPTNNSHSTNKYLHYFLNVLIATPDCTKNAAGNPTATALQKNTGATAAALSSSLLIYKPNQLYRSGTIGISISIGNNNKLQLKFYKKRRWRQCRCYTTATISTSSSALHAAALNLSKRICESYLALPTIKTESANHSSSSSSTNRIRSSSTIWIRSIPL